MTAVADCAQYGEPAPPSLLMAWRIEQWGDPYGKGWMHWPAGMIDRVTIANNVYKAFKAYLGAKKLTDFTASNPAAWEIVTSVMNLRKEHGN